MRCAGGGWRRGRVSVAPRCECLRADVAGRCAARREERDHACCARGRVCCSALRGGSPPVVERRAEWKAGGRGDRRAAPHGGCKRRGGGEAAGGVAGSDGRLVHARGRCASDPEADDAVSDVCVWCLQLCVWLVSCGCFGCGPA
eukprot:3198450-Rhodomonas_salina.1